MGFCCINLFKCLESSGVVFIQFIDCYILRNYVYFYVIVNNLLILIGIQDVVLLDGIMDEDQDFLLGQDWEMVMDIEDSFDEDWLIFGVEFK